MLLSSGLRKHKLQLLYVNSGRRCETIQNIFRMQNTAQVFSVVFRIPFLSQLPALAICFITALFTVKAFNKTDMSLKR